jgi:transposase
MSTSERRRFLAYEILRLRHAGRSHREISRALHIARKTVKRMLAELEERREEGESAVERMAGRPRVPKGSKLDAFEEKIRAWLEEYPDMTAVRCAEKLTEEEHFVGGYTIVRERLKRLRGELEPKAPAVPMDIVPGQRSEFDWSPYTLAGELTVQTWRQTLCWSRAMHMAGATNTKQTTIFTMLRLGFERWNGVPHECVTDSMPGVVDRWECDLPVLNARFVDLAAHYGFTAVIAPRHCPKAKPHVERGFWYHERNLLNARTITSFQQYCDLVQWWQRERAMRRPHPKTQRPIQEMFEEEKPHLLPLPAKPYDTRDVYVRIVNATGHVHHETNQYSVPDGHIGERVYVCVGLERVEIVGTRAQRLVEHERLADGAGVRLPPLASGHRPRRYDVECLLRRIAEWGDTAADFARRLKEAQRYAGLELTRLLNLQLEWSLDDLVAAMRHALDYRCYEVRAVLRILDARFTPRRLEAVIAESTRRRIQEVMKAHPVHSRPLGSYDSLTKGDRHEASLCPEESARPEVSGRSVGADPCDSGGDERPDPGAGLPGLGGPASPPGPENAG